MRAKRWVLFVVLLLFAGFVLIPIVTYVAGGRIVGPYAGSRGLASFLGSIYEDASEGRLLALALLFGPLLGVGIWPIRARAMRCVGRRPDPPEPGKK